jgi:2,5-diketo-D-gluconate reductase A
MSWSPLANHAELFNEKPVRELAEQHNVTPAQIVLRWHVDLGSTPIPKSSDPDRQRENADVFGFELSSEEIRAISALERGRLWGDDGDPEKVKF